MLFHRTLNFDISPEEHQDIELPVEQPQPNEPSLLLWQSTREMLENIAQQDYVFQEFIRPTYTPQTVAFNSTKDTLSYYEAQH